MHTQEQDPRFGLAECARMIYVSRLWAQPMPSTLSASCHWLRSSTEPSSAELTSDHSGKNPSQDLTPSAAVTWWRSKSPCSRTSVFTASQLIHTDSVILVFHPIPSVLLTNTWASEQHILVGHRLASSQPLSSGVNPNQRNSRALPAQR